MLPVVVIPLFASLVVGLLMFLLLGRPLAAITSGLTHWLSGLSGSSVILLGVILAAADGLALARSPGFPPDRADQLAAMQQMVKLDIAALERAAAG